MLYESVIPNEKNPIRKLKGKWMSNKHKKWIWNEMKWTWNSNSKMEIKVHLKIEKNSPLEQWKLTNGEWKKVDCNSARAN